MYLNDFHTFQPQLILHANIPMVHHVMRYSNVQLPHSDITNADLPSIQVDGLGFQCQIDYSGYLGNIIKKKN